MNFLAHVFYFTLHLIKDITTDQIIRVIYSQKNKHRITKRNTQKSASAQSAFTVIRAVKLDPITNFLHK